MDALGSLSRNPLYFKQTLVMAALVALTCVLSAVVHEVSATAWCALLGVSLIGVFTWFSLRRYGEIARLAFEVDEVLHGGRRVSFTDCREGDVAVLRNEIDKMVFRLARTTDQLEVEKRSLASAMADISHQIRTPLTAVSLKLATLERAHDDAERKRVMRDVEHLLDRVSWLVTSLLKMAKVDAGALAVGSDTVLVRQVVSQALRCLEIPLELRGVRFELHCDHSVSFTGDARWSAEAVENILKNCMEHTPEGGYVRVFATQDAIATHIVIEDTGCGIAAHDLPHIFDRFYSASHAHEGFGIGLSLAQSLLSAQGATLRAGNAAGGGARFEIAFPHLVV